MWLFHRRSGDVWWKQQAIHYSQLLEHRKDDRAVHDLGFIFLNTYRHWYEATGDDHQMDIVAEAGVTLARRYQDDGRYLASFLGPQSVFIDIMMNVSLLYVAADWLQERRSPALPAGLSDIPPTDFSGIAAELRRRATAHCVTSKDQLIRTDGSSLHEALFDTGTGHFLASTQQGLRPDSCWSRGLAWALYGFGTVYRHTGDQQFLVTACRCADWFIDHLPPGRVPYWDFDVSEQRDLKWDSSAAAIAASGLLQLAELTRKRSQAAPEIAETAPDFAMRAEMPAKYQSTAFEILFALCDDQFLARSVPGWEGILCHAVYHYHKKLGVDESVMWGDHFFVEALVAAASLALTWWPPTWR
jgi:unsaturated chondroitin disaccharide hydrolase